MSKYFPVDCKGCPYYHSYDMSVDDWTNVCDVLGAQIDDCDIDFVVKPKCPLKQNQLREGWHERVD